MRLWICTLAAGAAVMAGERPAVEPVGTVSIPGERSLYAARASADGRWMVFARSVRKDKARSSWTFTRFVLVDLRKAQVAPTEHKLTLGRNTPVFSRNARWLAWCPSDERIAVRDLREGTQKTHRVAALRTARGFATVCAVGDGGRRVATVVPGPGRHDDRLLVHDLEKRETLLTLPGFKEPYYGRLDFEVSLVRNGILSHARPSGVSGASYRLLLTDIETGKARGTYGAYVSNVTRRFHATRDGRTVFNGTGGWDLQRIDAATGAATTLMNVRKPLYSHFLEVTLSPNERLVACWSRERKVLAVWDREKRERFDVPLEQAGELLGIAADNRHAVLLSRRRLALVDLTAPKPAGRLVDGSWSWARLDPTGRTLVALRRKDDKGKNRRVELFRLGGK